MSNLDRLDVQLLTLLQEDGRMSVSELSKRLALSRPSVAERLRRLQESGVIEGFGARVRPASVGRGVLVFIQLSDFRVHGYREFEEWVSGHPDVLECHRLTGSVSYLIKAAVSDMARLGPLIDSLLEFGHANTSIVLSTPVTHRSVLPHENNQ